MIHENKNRPMSTEGMMALKVAVTQMACHDYAQIKMKKGKYAKMSDFVRGGHMAVLMDWFYGPVFHFWCQESPRKLLKQMDENIKNGFIFYCIDENEGGENYAS